MVWVEGFKPPTSWFQARNAIRLRYTQVDWCRPQESNPVPTLFRRLLNDHTSSSGNIKQDAFFWTTA
jgi:hypothetical protein